MSKEGESKASSLPQYILDAIYGKQSAEEKQEAYKKSLVNWWQVCGSCYLSCVASCCIRLVRHMI